MSGIHNVTVRYISRREFLRRLGLAAAGGVAASALGACGGTQPSPAAAPTAAPASAVGGQLDFYSWEGYDLLAATEKWRQDNKVDLKSAYIACSEDTTAKVLSPAGKGIDVITNFYGYYKAWSDLGMFTDFSVEEVPNLKRMYPFFQQGEFWRRPNGSYFGAPLTWLTYVCNYRADLIDPPQSWAELLDAKYKGKIALVDDPGANVLVASAILGIPTDTMTKAQLQEVKKFLLGLKANAKTIAPSYGDLSNLLISGEAVAGYVGWGALDLWAAKDGVQVKSVLPEDGVVISVDACAIPPTCDNRPTALAWLNLMLTDEVQLAVVNELLTATVCPDTVPLIEDEGVRNLYDYDNLEEFVKKHPLRLFPPIETTGEQASYTDWMKTWEEVKAG